MSKASCSAAKLCRNRSRRDKLPACLFFLFSIEGGEKKKKVKFRLFCARDTCCIHCIIETQYVRYLNLIILYLFQITISDLPCVISTVE